MRTITVKNIPLELYERLKMSATENRRSINSEIIVCIERGVHSRKVKVQLHRCPPMPLSLNSFMTSAGLRSVVTKITGLSAAMLLTTT